MTDKPAPTLADVAPNALDLTHERSFCPRHGEPFREQWPKGGLVFKVGAMKMLFDSTAFVEGAGQLAAERGDTSSRAFPNAAEAMLDQIPACCRITPEQAIELYLASGVADPAAKHRCVLCSNVVPDTPYRIAGEAGAVERLDHVCFWCVVHRMYSTLS